MGAFYNCKGLVNISLPSSLCKIPVVGFSNCDSLVKLDIPEGVSHISLSAFRACSNLVDVTLPKSLRLIDIGAFEKCSSLSKLDIPEGVQMIEEDAFKGCLALEEIELPDTITNIPIRCFIDCPKLKSIRMPKDVMLDSRPSEVIDMNNEKLVEFLAYKDNRSFFGTQFYLWCFYEQDLFDSIISPKTCSHERSERFEYALDRAKRYVKDHINCYTREMYEVRNLLSGMLGAVWLAMYNAQKDFWRKWERRTLWESSSPEVKRAYFYQAELNLVRMCRIFAEAYDLPAACEFLMKYDVEQGATLKYVDYYKRMARHEARWQRVFPKGSREYALAHSRMFDYIQAISNLGYDQQAQMLQLELEHEIEQSPILDEKQKFCTGTGWFVNKKCIATCWHVVNGAKKIKIELSNGRQFDARIVAKDVANDIAVLEVNGNIGAHSELPICARGVKLSDRVFTVGYPLASLLGQKQKYTDGSISALSGIADDNRYFQISVPLQPGNSGGPLVDEKGRVIGLTSAVLNAVKTAQVTGAIPQNVNYAIKARYLVAVLDDAGIDYVPQERSGRNDHSKNIEKVMDATCLVVAE